jgi:hypothetical protein
MSSFSKFLATTTFLTTFLITDATYASYASSDNEATAPVKAIVLGSEDPEVFVAEVLRDPACVTFERFTEQTITRYPLYVEFQARLESVFREFIRQNHMSKLVRKAREKVEYSEGKEDFPQDEWDEEKILASQATIEEWAKNPALLNDATFKKMFDKLVEKFHEKSASWLEREEKIKLATIALKRKYEKKAKKKTFQSFFKTKNSWSSRQHESWPKERWNWTKKQATLANLVMEEFQLFLGTLKHPLLQAVCIDQRSNFINTTGEPIEVRGKTEIRSMPTVFMIELLKSNLATLNQLKRAASENTDPAAGLKLRIMTGMQASSFADQDIEYFFTNYRTDPLEAEALQLDQNLDTEVRHLWLDLARDPLLEKMDVDDLSGILQFLIASVAEDESQTDSYGEVYRLSDICTQEQELRYEGNDLRLRNDLTYLLRAFCYKRANERDRAPRYRGFNRYMEEMWGCLDEHKTPPEIFRIMKSPIPEYLDDWRLYFESAMPNAQMLYELSNARQTRSSKLFFAARATHCLLEVISLRRSMARPICYPEHLVAYDQKRGTDGPYLETKEFLEVHPLLKETDDFLRELMKPNEQLMSDVFKQTIESSEGIILDRANWKSFLAVANAHVGLSTMTSDDEEKASHIQKAIELAKKIRTDFSKGGRVLIWEFSDIHDIVQATGEEISTIFPSEDNR